MEVEGFVRRSESSIVTSGDWCNGNRDGHGVYTYGNGDSYKGRFARNLRSGPGVFFHHESGMSYNCDWSNNIPTILPAKLRGACMALRS
mmetsp:Transcript_24766/g.81287  ORF Transcript_24766/g.81287 Transcript_24766/m.81287 type:complete len:89 (-) Transcript_24766:1525-1791(-)